MLAYARCLAAMLLAATSASPAQSAEWPAKPIHIVGAVRGRRRARRKCLGAGVIAEHLASRPPSQSVVVENKGGAGGIVGSHGRSRAPIRTVTTLAGRRPRLAGDRAGDGRQPAGYDALRRFHLRRLYRRPTNWVVPPSSDIHTVNDVFVRCQSRHAVELRVVRRRHARPSRRRICRQEAGRDAQSCALQHGCVHRQLSPAAFRSAPLPGTRCSASAQGGTLHPIAITTEARLPDFPNLPTFKELGYDLVASTWVRARRAEGNCRPRLYSGSIKEVVRIMDSARHSKSGSRKTRRSRNR